MVGLRSPQNDDSAVRLGGPTNVAIAEAHGNSPHGPSGTLDGVGKGPVRQNEVKGLAIGARDHRQALAKAMKQRAVRREPGNEGTG